MNTTGNRFNNISAETQREIMAQFGSIDNLYALIYLIAKNEHLTQEEKPEQWETKKRVINAYQERIRILLDKWELSGKDIVADITSDYLEDYINYREKDFGLTNEEFLNLIKAIP